MEAIRGRSLDQFQGRSPLGAWLHRIARREFLQSLRGQRPPASLEELKEFPAPRAPELTESIELRAVIAKLPLPQREVVVLHYLEGYTGEEIAQILDTPVTTVHFRLFEARVRLRRELGEGDLAYLNELIAPMRQWAWLPLDQMHALEARLTLESDAHKEVTSMERREFLRHAAVGAAGLMLSETEKEVVDDRLTRKVTCAFKGTALSDLCEKLKSDTGIAVAAGPSVADEKVTLFCEKRPLRDVMRQLSRPFGYTWLRTRQGLGVGSGELGRDGRPLTPHSQLPTPIYRYELVQDLRSQLLEEELRNRDRNAALLALERDLQRYRPFLDLSPDEARGRARQAPPEEKRLLETLAGTNWGALKLYFRLSPQQMAALRAGQELTFSQEPQPGEQPLPQDLVRGVLETVQRRVLLREPGWELTKVDDPVGLPLTAIPEARALVTMRLAQTEPGRFSRMGPVSPAQCSRALSLSGAAHARPATDGEPPHRPAAPADDAGPTTAVPRLPVRLPQRENEQQRGRH